VEKSEKFFSVDGELILDEDFLDKKFSKLLPIKLEENPLF
jgi:hypothetical protein